MIKVVLKEPVTSGYDQRKNLVDKAAQFFWVQGDLNQEFKDRLASEGTKWLSFIKKTDGLPLWVYVDNIAYLEEGVPSAGRQVS